MVKYPICAFDEIKYKWFIITVIKIEFQIKSALNLKKS
jgi:hypothetical protein